MKSLVFLLFVSLAHAKAPDCRELGQIIEGYEKDLQRKFIQNPSCSSISAQEFAKDLPVADKTFLEGKMCHSLSVIETELEKLKIEEAVLTGIDKLKKNLQAAKEEVETSKDEEAQKPAKTFVGSLNTAQSLEVMLKTEIRGGTSFLEKLKSIPEETRADLKSFNERIAEICRKETDTLEDACNPKVFRPSSETVQELNALLKSANPTKDQVEKWAGMLAIKKKGSQEKSDYSFTAMRAELEETFKLLDQKSPLSKDHLKAIRKLDDFESAPGFPFVEDLKKLKNSTQSRLLSERFKWLVKDAQNRQQYEVQSKLSVAWLEYKSLLGDSPDCDLTKSLFSKAESCLEHFRKKEKELQGDARATVEKLIPALEASLKYEQELSRLEETCSLEIEKKGLTENCLFEVNNQLGVVHDKILQLNLLKEKIGSENLDLMTMRNFALEKWGTQKCAVVSSNVDFCEDETTLSKEAMLTVGDMMDITVLYTPESQTSEKALALCDDADRKKTRVEVKLCEFFYARDPKKDVVVRQEAEKKKMEQEAESVNVAAPDGGNADEALRDGWIRGGSQIMSDVLKYLYQVPAPAITNPVPYNYSPYFANGTQGLGFADALTLNARYYGGYSFYMPTPGYQPYHAFTKVPMTTPYSPAVFPTTQYFTR
jgi:hypothetical protein